MFINKINSEPVNLKLQIQKKTFNKKGKIKLSRKINFNSAKTT